MTKKKRIELAAVSKFLRIKGIKTNQEDFEIHPDEPADIIYIPTGQKFQITQPQGEIGKLLSFGAVSFQHKADQNLQEFVEVAVKRKLQRYGGGHAVMDLTLLIYDLIQPPWLEKDLRESKDNLDFQSLLKASSFKDIYCVFNFPDNAGLIKVYPEN